GAHRPAEQRRGRRQREADLRGAAARAAAGGTGRHAAARARRPGAALRPDRAADPVLREQPRVAADAVPVAAGGPGVAVGRAAEEKIRGLIGVPADKLADALGRSVPGLAAGVVDDLSATAASLERLATERPLSWQFDPTLVRGMGYYTGHVFEIIHPEMSGSVAGGGRYDKLIGRSLGHDVPACGFSIGFERIVDLLSGEQSRDAIAVLVEADVPVPDAVAGARETREQAGPGRVG